MHRHDEIATPIRSARNRKGVPWLRSRVRRKVEGTVVKEAPMSTRLAVVVLALASCADLADSGFEQSALDSESAEGAVFFNRAFPRSNGRSCATCHIASDHFALTPQHVSELFALNPADPLFNRIDADDPGAPVPTYDHLKAGLI